MKNMNRIALIIIALAFLAIGIIGCGDKNGGANHVIVHDHDDGPDRKGHNDGPDLGPGDGPKSGGSKGGSGKGK